MLKSPISSWAIAAILASSASASTSRSRLHGRDLDAPLLNSYDYIVVGCGISGLVVANRLSEDPSATVLCVEAGVADHYEAVIQDPVYVGADVGGIYDWNLATVPQTQLDGASRPLPQGKVLGGGSILNAMVWNRGGQDDYNAWAALGNPGWDWAGLLPYFMKSETYTPVYSQDIAREYSINYNPSVHGTSGPIQVSYPKFFYPQSVNLFNALNILGVPTQFDPNDGTMAGAALVPTDIDPNNQTRSDARRAYYDPYANRDNFHVITGQHVTRVLIEGVQGVDQTNNPMSGGNLNGNGPASGGSGLLGFNAEVLTPSTPANSGQTSSRRTRRQIPTASNLRITGIEFAPNATAPRQTVYATREVIVAAGSLHSAQLLQLSGIGPASLLHQYSIPVAIDLPGVGNNLQDHCLVGTFYPYNNASYPSPAELTTNATYNAQAEEEYNAYKTGPWTAGSPNALAFPALPLISSNSDIILLNASYQGATDFLPPGLDQTIVNGYGRQKQSLVQRLAQRNVGAYEIINNNAGSLTVAVMHPFSRGTCFIQSPDPFTPPAIDPRWLSNPVDRQILVEALFFNRQILATLPMMELVPAQFVPPLHADEAAINQVIDNGIRTEYHPSGTCAMLPLNQGGVVDPQLIVYGTQNLRVVDAGIFPMVPAAHLQAVVYAVAEKAADIIKADNMVVQPSAPPSSTSLHGSSTAASLSSIATNSISALTSPASDTATATISNNTSSSFLAPNSIATSSSGSIDSPSALTASSAVGSFASSSGASRAHGDVVLSPSSASSLPSSNGGVVSMSSTSTSIASRASSAAATSTHDLGSFIFTVPSPGSEKSSSGVSTFSLSSSTAASPVGPSSLTNVVAVSVNVPSVLSSVSSIIATTTPPPTPSVLDAGQLSSSVVAALMSGGVDPSDASSLAPVIIGTITPSMAASLVSTASTSTSMSLHDQQIRQGVIAEFVRWLLALFNIQ